MSNKSSNNKSERTVPLDFKGSDLRTTRRPKSKTSDSDASEAFGINACTRKINYPLFDILNHMDMDLYFSLYCILSPPQCSIYKIDASNKGCNRTSDQHLYT